MFLSNEIDYGVMWESEAIYWKFKHFYPFKSDESIFSMVLLEGSSEAAETVFNEFRSGNISHFYSRYGFKLLAQLSKIFIIKKTCFIKII